ncbi:MAG TPA: helix-turn-helix domain-containing protein [Steroidobacter sp.]|jgi:DNA-binding NtrC family response regulator|nr:helix-turn-helix domain-containing protein [Steroidobacter sp.]
MENPLTNTAPGELRSERGDVRPPSQDPAAQGQDSPDGQDSAVQMQRIDSLRIPVGTNLADAERWMIFATLQKCGGNKTRAAALLGVSLKTLYNRLNAYRAQGLAMDYDARGYGASVDQSGSGQELVGNPARLEGSLSETTRETQ